MGIYCNSHGGDQRLLVSQLTGNRIVLKDERMVLPATLQEIKLAHTAAHPGQQGLKQRLR